MRACLLMDPRRSLPHRIYSLLVSSQNLDRAVSCFLSNVPAPQPAEGTLTKFFPEVTAAFHKNAAFKARGEPKRKRRGSSAPRHRSKISVAVSMTSRPDTEIWLGLTWATNELPIVLRCSVIEISDIMSPATPPEAPFELRCEGKTKKSILLHRTKIQNPAPQVALVSAVPGAPSPSSR